MLFDFRYRVTRILYRGPKSAAHAGLMPECLASTVKKTWTRTSSVTDSIAGKSNALQRLFPADPAVRYPGRAGYERFRNTGLAIAS